MSRMWPTDGTIRRLLPAQRRNIVFLGGSGSKVKLGWLWAGGRRRARDWRRKWEWEWKGLLVDTRVGAMICIWPLPMRLPPRRVGACLLCCFGVLRQASAALATGRDSGFASATETGAVGVQGEWAVSSDQRAGYASLPPVPSAGSSMLRPRGCPFERESQ